MVVVPASPPSVSSSIPYSYSYKVLLPQTDGTGSIPLFYGVLFSPYSSIISSCSNIFNLMTLSALNQSIAVSNITISGIVLNYLCDISFDVQFSTSRINLMTSSQITIQFTNAVTTSLTSCSIWTPQMFSFLQ